MDASAEVPTHKADGNNHMENDDPSGEPME